MSRNGISQWLLLALVAPLMSGAIGCQSSIGGQTLPSPWYLTDDVQYFPPGPEFKLSNQVRAMEEYKLEQDRLRSGIEDEVN